MNRLSARHWFNAFGERAAWFLAWFCLPFSLKLGGASIVLVSMVVLISFAGKPFVPDKRKVKYLLLPVMFFLWQAKDLLYDRPLLPAWKETEQMLSFAVIPVIFAISRTGKKTFTKMALAGIVSGLAIAGTVMLVSAASRFVHSGSWSEFTYHNLARPFHAGAVYFSFFLLTALFKLDDPVWPDRHARLKVFIVVFFLVLFLLCASKLMIGLGLPLLAWHHRRFIFRIWHTRRTLVFMAFLVIAAGSVPFFTRLQPLYHPNIGMVTAENFKNHPEPDGLTLRLVLWRFGLEIMEEQHAWITGTGMNRSQPLLNLKMEQHGLFTGLPGNTGTGYLNYNYHNQYIETLVRTGIPGLVLLVIILITFVLQPRENLFAPKPFIWLVAGFFLTESVLERQAGIILFCLLYSAFYTANDHAVNSDDR